jgi:hypothetical protein
MTEEQIILGVVEAIRHLNGGSVRRSMEYFQAIEGRSPSPMSSGSVGQTFGLNLHEGVPPHRLPKSKSGRLVPA